MCALQWKSAIYLKRNLRGTAKCTNVSEN